MNDCVTKDAPEGLEMRGAAWWTERHVKLQSPLTACEGAP
jgi:hypothetical protein